MARNLFRFVLISVLVGSCSFWNLAPALRLPTPVPPTATALIQAAPQADPTHAILLPQVLNPAQPSAVPAPALVPTLQEPRVSADTYYRLVADSVIGPYAVRLWQNMGDTYFGNVVTIATLDQPLVQIEEVSSIDFSGRDLTGNGTPDLVVQRFTGGAHCCFSTIIYDLGPTLEKVLDPPPSNCPGELRDLDQDGIPEYLTCDDQFAYYYCCFAGSPLVTVVLEYVPGSGYVPASPDYPDVYTEEIAAHLKQAQEGNPGECCEWDGTNKCSVLPLVLDYLYQGRTLLAWESLHRYYVAPDLDIFQAEVDRMVRESPFYRLP